jgi:hypothetical protein
MQCHCGKDDAVAEEDDLNDAVAEQDDGNGDENDRLRFDIF